MKIEVYRREDGKWAWRFKAANGEILSNDAGQGFENKGDAIDSAVLATGAGSRADHVAMVIDGVTF